jgi:hypothetical protein
LRAIEIAGMDREHVGVHGRCRIFQIDQHLDYVIGFARGEGEQRMVVEAQVIEDFQQLRGVGHGDIVLSRRVRENPPPTGTRCGAFSQFAKPAFRDGPLAGGGKFNGQPLKGQLTSGDLRYAEAIPLYESEFFRKLLGRHADGLVAVLPTEGSLGRRQNEVDDDRRVDDGEDHGEESVQERQQNHQSASRE